VCAKAAHKGAPAGGFSLPPSLPPLSPLRKSCCPLQKKKKKKI